MKQGVKVGDKIVSNKNVKGCVFCQNPDLSAVVDPILFTASIPINELKSKLEVDGIFVDVADLKLHREHIFFEYDESAETDLDSEIQKIKDSENIDVITEELAKINLLERRMILEGKENTPTHAKLLREKRELLLLKARLDGEIVDKVEHIVPAWVQYIEDE